jgi:hypothetical protein
MQKLATLKAVRRKQIIRKRILYDLKAENRGQHIANSPFRVFVREYTMNKI